MSRQTAAPARRTPGSRVPGDDEPVAAIVAPSRADGDAPVYPQAFSNSAAPRPASPSARYRACPARHSARWSTSRTSARLSGRNETFMQYCTHEERGRRAAAREEAGGRGERAEKVRDEPAARRNLRDIVPCGRICLFPPSPLAPCPLPSPPPSSLVPRPSFCYHSASYRHQTGRDGGCWTNMLTVGRHHRRFVRYWCGVRPVTWRPSACIW